MSKFALTPKVAEALGIGVWASERDVLARIQQLDDRMVDTAIESGRIDPSLRGWARQNFAAFKELVKNVPAGGLAQLARNRAAETGESLAEAQRAVVRQNPELYSARGAGRVVEDDGAALRHAASGALATLTSMERERQGSACTWDEAARITFAKHPALVRQYQTGQVDNADVSNTDLDNLKVPVIEQEGPSLEQQLVGVRKALRLAADATWAQIQAALAALTKPADGGTSVKTSGPKFGS